MSGSPGQYDGSGMVVANIVLFAMHQEKKGSPCKLMVGIDSLGSDFSQGTTH